MHTNPSTVAISTKQHNTKEVVKYDSETQQQGLFLCHASFQALAPGDGLRLVLCVGWFYCVGWFDCVGWSESVLGGLTVLGGLAPQPRSPAPQSRESTAEQIGCDVSAPPCTSSEAWLSIACVLLLPVIAVTPR